MNSLPPVVLSSPSRGFRQALLPVLSSCLSVLAATLLVASASSVLAQAGRPGLITQAVNEDSRVVLFGNTHPLATKAADRGVVEPSMPAERMLLLLKRSPEKELALRSTIESLHDQNSPNFHKWMTPEQFGAQWGAADSDIAAVTAWLQSHGFQVAGATSGRTAIEFSGTAGQVQEAFHTAIHSYMVNGELHHANSKDPEIPSALAPVVAGISTLNDFRPKSMAKKGPRGIYDPETSRVKPELTVSGSFGNFLYVVPADAATIYNTPIHALNPAYGGSTVDGTGAKIGVLGDSNISLSQVANYRKLFGLSAKAPTVILDGSKDPGINGDAVEAYLDLEVAGGLAPGAAVYFYTAADTSVNYGLDLATIRAINDNKVDVLNMSFGACEGGLSTSVNQFYESVWEQAAAQGISVTVSTGDSGSAGCDDPNTQTEAFYGLQVNGLASTPFNIAVGGTDFAPLAGPDGFGADFTNYVSKSNKPSNYGSAKMYIPEAPWNDTSFTFPPTNVSATSAAPSPYGNIVGAGGGKSNCAQGHVNNAGNLVCQAGYPKPSWQAALTPKDHVRDLPDVSLFAANGLDYAAWGICTDQDTDSTGSPIKDCTKGSDGLPAGSFYVYGVGGTSASAPAFAGILALVRQSTGERQGQANYVLYNLAHNTPGSFHDVVTGNNSVPCAKGYPNCKLNAAGSYYLTGYDAVAGYDLASGLGSVDVAALIANWSSAGLASTTTQLTLTPTSLQHGQKVVARAVVTASGGTATGDVALSANPNPTSFPTGAAIGTYSLLSNGTTGNISLTDLPGGTYSLIASYGGSEKFSQSISSPITVTVSPEASITTVSFTAYDPVTNTPSTSNTVPYGHGVNFSAHPYGIHSPIVAGVVQPDGIATGTVTFSSGSQNFGTDQLSLDGYALNVGHLLPAGTHPISATYHGDNSFNASVGTRTLTITKAVTTIALSASSNRNTGKPITFNVHLTTMSAGAAPTGRVALKSGSMILAEGTLQGVAATSSALASGTATITTANLPKANAEIYAVYLGDTNYATSTSTSLLIKGRPYFVMASISLQLPAEHSTAAAYIVTTSKDGYQGTIDFSCKLISKAKTATPAECALDKASRKIAPGKTVRPLILIYGKGTKLPPGATQGENTTPSFGLKVGAGGAVLACCLLLGIPARRRGWRSILSILLLLVAASGFTACITPAKIISAGGYVFQVTGTDSVDPTNTTTATVKVNVL